MTDIRGQVIDFFEASDERMAAFVEAMFTIMEEAGVVARTPQDIFFNEDGTVSVVFRSNNCGIKDKETAVFDVNRVAGGFDAEAAFA